MRSECTPNARRSRSVLVYSENSCWIYRCSAWAVVRGVEGVAEPGRVEQGLGVLVRCSPGAVWSWCGVEPLSRKSRSIEQRMFIEFGGAADGCPRSVYAEPLSGSS